MIFVKDHVAKYAGSSLKIDCGDYSYGVPVIEVAKSDKARTLMIGRYCSIARGCRIFVGRQGIHPLDTVSSYPLGMFVSPDLKGKYPTSSIRLAENLDVKIGHDVWIGMDVTIKAGVEIGTGAVVGVGSVVTKNVEPYSIVGGVPAKHIKYRFSPEIIETLLQSQFWLLEPDQLFEALEGQINAPMTLELACKLRNYCRSR